MKKTKLKKKILSLLLSLTIITQLVFPLSVRGAMSEAVVSEFLETGVATTAQEPPLNANWGEVAYHFNFANLPTDGTQTGAGAIGSVPTRPISERHASIRTVAPHASQQDFELLIGIGTNANNGFRSNGTPPNNFIDPNGAGRLLGASHTLTAPIRVELDVLAVAPTISSQLTLYFGEQAVTFPVTGTPASPRTVVVEFATGEGVLRTSAFPWGASNVNDPIGRVGLQAVRIFEGTFTGAWIDAENQDITFGPLPYGFTANHLETQYLEITNVGSEPSPITATIGNGFEIVQPPSATLQPGEGTLIGVRPVVGLTSGIHESNLIVSATADGNTLTTPVSVTINEPLTLPSDVVLFYNGDATSTADQFPNDANEDVNWPHDFRRISFTAGSHLIRFNGETRDAHVNLATPFLLNDVLWVPLTAAAAALPNTTWDLTNGYLTVTSDAATYNGIALVATEAEHGGDATFVALQEISEALNIGNIGWDARSQTLIIVTGTAVEQGNVLYNNMNNRPEAWYGSPNSIAIATNFVYMQRANGGWPRGIGQINALPHQPDIGGMSPEVVSMIAQGFNNEDSYFGRGITTNETRFLLRMYEATGIERFLESGLRGFDTIITTQDPIGGWPYQISGGSYHRALSISDHAISNLLWLMMDIEADNLFVDTLGEVRVNQAVAALERGMDWLLNTQVRSAGFADGMSRLTAWPMAVYQSGVENFTLIPGATPGVTGQPAWQREFEPMSINGNESVEIIRFLMSIPNPSEEIKEAIHAAVYFFNYIQIDGYRLNHASGLDPLLGRNIVPEEGARPLWPRFIDLENFEPLFYDRTGPFAATVSPHQNVNIADFETEHGAWLGYRSGFISANATSTGTAANAVRAGTLRNLYRDESGNLSTDRSGTFDLAASFHNLSFERRSGFNYINHFAEGLQQEYAEWLARMSGEINLGQGVLADTWYETAFAIWEGDVAGEYRAYVRLTPGYNAYYWRDGRAINETDPEWEMAHGWTLVDTELLRLIDPARGLWRVDVLGLPQGTYDIQIRNVEHVIVDQFNELETESFSRLGAAFVPSNELIGNSATTNFALHGATGGYLSDGRIDPNAVIMYVSHNNWDDFTLPNLQLGSAYRNGNPLVVRFLGSVGDFEHPGVGTLADANAVLPPTVTTNNRMMTLAAASHQLTLEGVGSDAEIYGWGIFTNGAVNVVVRNLGFSNFFQQGLRASGNTTNFWVHHNTFYFGQNRFFFNDEETDRTMGQGSVDIEQNVRGYTIGYNHFNGGRGTHLITGSVQNQPLSNHVHRHYGTLHHNIYDSAQERNPRTRHHNLHMFNNLFRDVLGHPMHYRLLDRYTGYGVGAAHNATIWAEGNIFDEVGFPFLRSRHGHARGYYPHTGHNHFWPDGPGFIVTGDNISLETGQSVGAMTIPELGADLGYRNTFRGLSNVAEHADFVTRVNQLQPNVMSPNSYETFDANLDVGITVSEAAVHMMPPVDDILFNHANPNVSVPGGVGPGFPALNANAANHGWGFEGDFRPSTNPSDIMPTGNLEQTATLRTHIETSAGNQLAPMVYAPSTPTNISISLNDLEYFMHRQGSPMPSLRTITYGNTFTLNWTSSNDPWTEFYEFEFEDAGVWRTLGTAESGPAPNTFVTQDMRDFGYMIMRNDDHDWIAVHLGGDGYVVMYPRVDFGHREHPHYTESDIPTIESLRFTDPWVVADAINGGDYHFRVRAVNRLGVSDWAHLSYTVLPEVATITDIIQLETIDPLTAGTVEFEVSTVGIADGTYPITLSVPRSRARNVMPWPAQQNFTRSIMLYGGDMSNVPTTTGSSPAQRTANGGLGVMTVTEGVATITIELTDDVPLDNYDLVLTIAGNERDVSLPFALRVGIELPGSICPTIATGSFAGAAGSQWRICEDGTLEIDEGAINWTGALSPWHAHRDLITQVEITGPIRAGASLRALFRELTFVTGINGLTYFDTSVTTSMYRMFFGLSGVTGLDVTNFATNNVTNMALMFRDASSLVDLDVSNFDTTGVTDMREMFRGTSIEVLDLSGFDTGNVTNMNHMFTALHTLRELTLGEAFSFTGTPNLVPIRQTEEFTGLWQGEGIALTSAQLMAQFDGSTMAGTFVRQIWTEVDPEVCDIVARGRFANGVAIGGAQWHLCDDGTLEVGSGFINWTLVTSPWHANRADITEIVFTGEVTAGASLRSLFHDLHNLEEIHNLAYLDTSQTTNMARMFRGASSLTELDLSSFDTTSVTDMSWMFFGASGLESLDVTNFATNHVTNMALMFREVSSLTELDVSNFNTSNVTDMREMFRGMSSLTTLDLANFDTTHVMNMNHMFIGMSALTELILGDLFTPIGNPGIPRLN